MVPWTNINDVKSNLSHSDLSALHVILIHKTELILKQKKSPNCQKDITSICKLKKALLFNNYNKSLLLRVSIVFNKHQPAVLSILINIIHEKALPLRNITLLVKH